MPQRYVKPRKNCPYVVTITCNLTPPYNFIRETQHTSREIALKVVRKAKQEFKGTPGLKIELKSRTKEEAPKTSWARILTV